MKNMNEQEVLKKLGITDFGHLTKDNVIKFASMIDKMEPEVAKKAIEQFPHFADSVKETMDNYTNTINNIVQANGESVKAYNDACIQTINTLNNMLENDSKLSFDQKMYILQKINEIQDKMSKNDSENKKFNFASGCLISATAVALLAILATSLGNTIQVNNEPIKI